MKKRAFALLLALCALASTAALGETYEDFDGWQQRFQAAWEENHPGTVEVRDTPETPAGAVEKEPVMLQLWLEDMVLLSVQPVTDSEFPHVTLYMTSDAAGQAASPEDAYALFAEAIYDAVVATMGQPPAEDAAELQAALAQHAAELLEDTMFPMRTHDTERYTVVLTQDQKKPNLVAIILWKLS